jgi:hypothetical protein
MFSVSLLATDHEMAMLARRLGDGFGQPLDLILDAATALLSGPQDDYPSEDCDCEHCRQDGPAVWLVAPRDSDWGVYVTDALETNGDTILVASSQSKDDACRIMSKMMKIALDGV